MVIILLYSRLRQMTTPASITSLYLSTKARPECGTPLISMPHPCNIHMSERLLLNVQHGPLDSTSECFITTVTRGDVAATPICG